VSIRNGICTVAAGRVYVLCEQSSDLARPLPSLGTCRLFAVLGLSLPAACATKGFAIFPLSACRLCTPDFLLACPAVRTKKRDRSL